MRKWRSRFVCSSGWDTRSSKPPCYYQPRLLFSFLLFPLLFLFLPLSTDTRAKHSPLTLGSHRNPTVYTLVNKGQCFAC